MSTETQTTKEPTVKIVLVRPQQATKWLERNHDRNRKVRPWKVAEYAADMLAGRWVLSDQAITFNTDDWLINGQHRLKAVEKAGVDVRFLVLRNAPERALLVIDGGMKRSTNDHLGMAGRDYPTGCGATVRRVMTSTSSDRDAISDWKVDEFMAEHGAAVAFVHTATTKHKVTLAPVRAVLTRAKIGRVPGERLERFVQVLETGLMGPGENAAVLLRNYILDCRHKAGTAESGTARKLLYAVTETALKAFLAGERPAKLEPTKVELFRINTDA